MRVAAATCTAAGDLLGGEEDLVGRFEDVFVGGVVEWHIAEMCLNIDR